MNRQGGTLREQNEALVELTRRSTSSGDVGQAMRPITESAAQLLKIARSSVWLLDAARTEIRCVDLYRAEEQDHIAGMSLKASDFPKYFQALEEDVTILAHDAHTDPRTAEFSEIYLKPLGITSMLDSPIRVGGRTVGVICNEHCGSNRKWTEGDQHFADCLASLIAVAIEGIERERAQRALQLSEERYRLISRATNDVIWDHDLATNHITWGEAMPVVFGHELTPAIENYSFWSSQVHPEDRDWVCGQLKESIEGGQHFWRAEYRFRTAKGNYVFVEDRGYVIRDESGAPARLVGAMIDITQRKEAENELRHRDKLLQALALATQEMLACPDLEIGIYRAFESVAKSAEVDRIVLFEHGENGKSSKTPRFEWRRLCVPPVPRKAISDSEPCTSEPSTATVPVIINGHEWGTLGFHDCRLKRTWTEAEVSILTALASSVAGAIARSQSEARLDYDSKHDALTGLPNRAFFTERVSRAVRCGQEDKARKMAVMFLDLDRFKIINDSLGHAAGDQLLITVAERLKACVAATENEVGATGVIGRLGGDEFTILLERLSSDEAACELAERILATLKEPVAFGGQDIVPSASVGLVIANGGEYETAKDLLRDADTSMYQAKSLGRSRYVRFHESMHSAAMKRLNVENDLRRAIERDELLLYYQPIVSLETGKPFGFEALMRWNRDGKLVSPVEFIPVAEDTGLIVAMGTWLITEACEQLAAWNRKLKGGYEVAMSVNLSRRQLRDLHLVEHLKATLERTGVRPSQLKMEITESTIMEQPETALAMLNEIKALGVQLAIDDFGTGYSSLACLNAFPLDLIKIDRAFASNISDRRDGAAVNAIVSMAHSLGIPVVAEGLETPEQVAFLQSLGCEYGQGYFFAKPMAASLAGEWLEKQLGTETAIAA